MYPLLSWTSALLRAGATPEALGSFALEDRDRRAHPPATGSLARQRLIRQAMDDRFSGNQSSPEPDWMTSWSGVKKRVGDGAGRLKEEMKQAFEPAPAPFADRFPLPPRPVPAPVEVVSPDQFNRMDAAAPPAPPEPQMASAPQFPSPAPSVESPHGAVELPPPPWRQNAAAAPATQSPAAAPGQMPWWIRNGMMQRDEQGNFLDQQMAQRAMGSFNS